MNEIIQINLKAPILESEDERLDFACSLAAHIMETFNDDESITECHYKLFTEGEKSLGQTN